MLSICKKILFKIRFIFIKHAKNKPYYVKLYKSYWHYLSHKNVGPTNNKNYFSATPNPGAGIGHQMANWIAGYWFAKKFELKFAHIPFSNPKWEKFLGFGENEVTVDELVKKRGFKKVRLPLFDEFNQKELDLISNIIKSYNNQKVVFIAEQDQFYRDQFGVMDDIKRKFHNAKARQYDKLLYSKEYFNIAVHVRRGDIMFGQKNRNPNLLMRWQHNDYFVNILTKVIRELKKLNTEKQIEIYLFSQGETKDFSNFAKFENLHFCLDWSPEKTFLHMVFADLLITSKSSFSYKPALMSNGIKICPKNFWHGYPKKKDWIIAEENGHFNLDQLISNIKSMGLGELK
jgi:hypothetical protein